MPKLDQCSKCSSYKKGTHGMKCSFRNIQPQFDEKECVHFQRIPSMINLEKEEPSSSEKLDTYEEFYAYAYDQWANTNISKEALVGLLIKKGMSKSGANALATTIIQGQEPIFDSMDDSDNDGAKDMLIGALWFIGGSVLTAIGYSSASNGGTYTIFWGAIVWGGIQFFKGLINKLD